MGHVDASAAAAAARDAKKKRGNRSSAKLKQCKLDARREQWLSQVKDGKEAKASTSPTGTEPNAGSMTVPSPHPPLPRRRVDVRSKGGDPEEDREERGAARQELGSSYLDSPVHSPSSDNSGSVGGMHRKHYNNGGGLNLSSSSSVWSSSRSVSEAEDDDTGGPEEENGVLDDWEAVADADALTVDDCHSHQSSGHVTPPAAPNVCTAPANQTGRQDPIQRTKAWAPDDIFRPQSLPSISRQVSFPASIGNGWMGAAQQANLSTPLTCPICCEDLDLTDSSFCPCPCKFRLCLFCHNKILEADGRCPGCRKEYVAARLSRSARQLLQSQLS
uniref:RING-type domain-containing protein n=1 Tax=Oryza rufipogon TaxID=4529 RepID=A0A0E0PA69_ORYRU